MSNQDQLAWERRLAPLAALAAAVAAGVLFTQIVLEQAVVLADRPETTRGYLLAVDEHAGTLIVSRVMQAIGSIALLVVLWYLFKATRHRRPELPGVLIYLVYAGPLLYGLGGLLGVLDQIDVADTFASGEPTLGEEGEERADDLSGSPGVPVIATSAAGGLAVAILFVLVSLNAMRAGLVSRFTGILGVIVGALTVLPLFPGGSIVIEVFWLGSLIALFTDRWPGGRGRAWSSGRAEVWPTAAQRRAAAAEAEAPPEPAEPERKPSRKRNRKKRR